MKTIRCYEPGSWCIIGNNTPATIVQIQIMGTELAIRYEVVWWSNLERKEMWVPAHEVQPHPDSKVIEIGFHTCELG